MSNPSWLFEVLRKARKDVEEPPQWALPVITLPLPESIRDTSGSGEAQ